MTPASVIENALGSILESRITPYTEWTMEANPSSITLDSLREYTSLGVNRISMGVQSLRNDHLTMLGRVHNREAALRALGFIFEAGISNVSVDLLCGVPGQTLEDLSLALDELTQFPITHLSCYLLTLSKHHKMYSDLPNEETQLEHLLHLDSEMRGRGFSHYEISNFARTGHEARHNLNYWKGTSYLGLGPSAHSFDSEKGVRFKNFSSLHKYAESLSKDEFPIEWIETLTPDQKRIESWMLALRLRDGFPETWLDEPRRKSQAKMLMNRGLLQLHPNKSGFLNLTPRGFALSDQVISNLV